MSLLNNLLSSIDPSAAAQISASAPRQPAAAAPKPTVRPAVSDNNRPSQVGPPKRKADGQPDGAQTKVQRRDGPIPPARPNAAARPAPNPDVAKTKPTSSGNDIPYRGTAGNGGVIAPKSASAIAARKPVPATSTVTKKPTPTISTAAPVAKSAPPASKTPVTPTSAARPVPKKGYAAMLQQAKQREQSKAPAPPVRHEPVKILSKKEREALRAAAKGKQPAPNNQKAAANAKGNDAKTTDLKAKSLEKAKTVGYQGTARPAPKPADSGYKGTAKPAGIAAPGSAGKYGGTTANKGKQSQQTKRYDGYANWSDLDEMEDEEDDYASEDDLSDMEGGMWDVEDEEQLALRAARKEDAEALAEENEHKRQKEERKRKLAAMAKAAAGKRRY